MLDFLFSEIDDKVINFETLKLHDKPNQFLMLPEGTFSETPHQLSPVLKLSVNDLQNRFKEIAEGQEKVTLIRTSDDGKQLDYVQRTPFMGYPDTITVRFYPQSAETSSVAIYSRSRYGHSDLGANEKRVKLWLEMLRD